MLRRNLKCNTSTTIINQLCEIKKVLKTTVTKYLPYRHKFNFAKRLDYKSEIADRVNNII